METESKDDFEKWIAKLVENHQNPVIKFPLQKNKQFDIGEGDAETMASKLDVVKTTASSERVELKSARAIAEWVEELCLIKVTNLLRTKIQTMGFQNADGKFLQPFEALFLLETNRLEIVDRNHVPWTVTKAYSVLLKSNRDLEEYKGYRKLALMGYDLKCTKMEKVEPDAKKFKTSHSHTTLSKRNIFDDLKLQGPKYNDDCVSTTSKWSFRANDDSFQPLDFTNGNDYNSQVNLQKGETKVICITSGETSYAEIECVETPDIPSAEISNQ